jgi:hypothetical protein
MERGGKRSATPLCEDGPVLEGSEQSGGTSIGKPSCLPESDQQTTTLWQ